MASLSGTLYIGISGNSHKRVFQHKLPTSKDSLHDTMLTRLVDCETYNDVRKAIGRETELKG